MANIRQLLDHLFVATHSSESLLLLAQHLLMRPLDFAYVMMTENQDHFLHIIPVQR
jgi:hypothetical protein